METNKVEDITIENMVANIFSNTTIIIAQITTIIVKTTTIIAI